jgi:hypothetical protein
MEKAGSIWMRGTSMGRSARVPRYWQKIEFERPHPMPSFQTEAAYQQPDGPAGRANASDLACRMQTYYVALGRGCGGEDWVLVLETARDSK